MSRFYKHFKDPNKVYEIVDYVMSAHTGQPMVLYRNLAEPKVHWVRDKEEFFGVVERDGETFIRFTPLDHLPVPEDHTDVAFPC